MNESTLVPREEMSDLDWLARNVHVWPENGNNMRGGFIAGSQYYGPCCSEIVWCKGGITKRQWLARRAKLQNKPSWNDAPEWAGWLNQDADGVWNWQRIMAVSADDCGYWFGGARSESAGIGEVLGDWRDTLEKRPEQTIADIYREVTGENRHEEIFEPFVSVEDAKITIMQSDGDVKNFGGIIGRILPLKEDAATAKQPAPKGSGNPILGMVLADLTNRAMEGKEKYGEPLLAHNGRNALWDLYQELLDAAMYIRQAIEEQK